MPVHRVGPDEARTLLQSGVDLVDVREPHEWAQGHVPGARHVPLGELMRDPQRHLPRDRVMFVCAHGQRSLAAATVATRIGHQEVYSLDGGTVDWAARGLPVESAAERLTCDGNRCAARRPTAALQPTRARSSRR